MQYFINTSIASTVKTLYYKGVYVLAFVVKRYHQRLRRIACTYVNMLKLLKV